ncbi:hypothetical protein EUGRSUZ_F04392 [Eucalyptus grandis]|uniref:Uncharacterized protein n=2 Tax=Eucalyptus grandis TaxID=71139 RepID=A0ACC3KPX3_EUCGR|nr:hypothetical protein EUGRSUZ_F04392 [Eucalyptus grandis]
MGSAAPDSSCSIPPKTTPTLCNLKRPPKYQSQTIYRPQIWPLQSPNPKILPTLRIKKEPNSRAFKWILSPSSTPD